MGDRSSGGSGGQCGSAGVGEEIQYLYGTSGIADFFTEPVPVGSLLGEEACMLEAEGLQIEC